MITLRFVWNVPTDPASRSFTVQVPDAAAAADTIGLYDGDDRAFVVYAEDSDGGWLGSAQVGGGQPMRVALG